jgi:transcription-repair coupling factor (superfamily II helicase)
VRIEAQVDAYVPADYIPLEAVKVDLHRRVALAPDRSALRELRVELADRFGPVPDPVENLIAIQEARLIAAELGADQVTFKGGKLTVSPVQLSSSDVRALKESHPQALYTVARHEVSHRNIPINSSSQLPIRDALEILDAMVEIRRDHAA